MAHELTIREDGIVEAFYGNNQPAWHKLGKVVDGSLTAKEAIAAAGLNWKVKAAPVLMENHKRESVRHFNEFIPRTTEFKNRFITYREDNDKMLGIVSNRYEIVQNEDAFNFVDSLAVEGGLKFDSAGSMKDGKKVWMMAKFPKEFAITPDDVNYNYLAIYNSHDGSTPIMIIPTTVRIVCWNTLQIAVSKARMQGTLVRLKHTNNITFKLEEVRSTLGLLSSELQQANNLLLNLSSIKVYQDDVSKYIDAMFPLPTVPDEHLKMPGSSMPVMTFDEDSLSYKKQKKVQEQIEYNFYDDPKQKTKATKNTAYGLLNAVTQYVDHQKNVNGTAESTKNRNRMESAWLGHGVNFKQKALQTAESLFLS